MHPMPNESFEQAPSGTDAVPLPQAHDSFHTTGTYPLSCCHHDAFVQQRPHGWPRKRQLHACVVWRRPRLAKATERQAWQSRHQAAARRPGPLRCALRLTRRDSCCDMLRCAALCALSAAPVSRRPTLGNPLPSTAEPPGSHWK